MTESVPGNGVDLDQWVADAKAKAARLQEMRSGVERVSVSQSSADGVVAVTVDAAGTVTDLQITDRIREMSGAKVAALVLSTMRRAQARIVDEVAEVMSSTVGDDQTTVDTVMSRYRSRFPEPEPEEEPHSPAREHEEIEIEVDDSDDIEVPRRSAW